MTFWEEGEKFRKELRRRQKKKGKKKKKKKIKKETERRMVRIPGGRDEKKALCSPQGEF